MMDRLREFRSRLLRLFRRGKLESDMAEEMRWHLENEAATQRAQGLGADEAQAAALRQFGGVDQIKELVRAQRGMPVLEHLVQDLRQALRQLRKAPGFATFSILSVAIGIGSCTALFSIVDSVLLRPLDFPQSERIMLLNETDSLNGAAIDSVTPGVYLDWLKQTTVFENIAAGHGRSYHAMVAGRATSIGAQCITPNYFSVFGIEPILGRVFRPDEATAGKQHVVILSYRCWQKQFGGRDNVIDETLELDGQAFTIVGVMPDNLIWNPLVFTPAVFSAADRADYGSHSLLSIGRLKPGVSVKRARSEMDLVSAGIAHEHPDTNKGHGAHVTPILEAMTSNVRMQLLVLLGAVGLVLLIACVNVANLLLARANSRQKEIAVRAALGASRGRIVQQFLCESFLIALAGGTLGVLTALGSMGVLVRFAGQLVPRAKEISLNGTACATACGLMLLAGFGCGLVPALQAIRGDMTEALKEAGRNASSGRKRQGLRAALVMAEIALALILLAGAGLLARSLLAMQEADQGFKTRNLYVYNLTLTGPKYDPSTKTAAFVDEAISRIAALPQVHSVAFSHGLPSMGIDGLLFATAAQSAVAASSLPDANAYAITPDYFKAMSIPLVRGRRFTSQDAAGVSPVVIINQNLAQKYFPNVDPVGKRLMVLTMANTPDVWREIVGVVGDVRAYGPQSTIGPQLYEPLAQHPSGDLSLVVRAQEPASALPGAVRDVIHSLDPNLPFGTIYPYDRQIESYWSKQRFSLILFSLFSGVALLLSGIGVYGVIAYSVNQRTNEIGIRMALGAQSGDVLRLILGTGAKILALGLLIGAAGSLAATRLLQSLLFATSPYDPLTFLAVGGLLGFVALLACWFPARQATKVDPMTALRCE